MKRIVFDSGVLSDLRSTERFLEEKQPGLGHDFITRALKQFQYLTLYPLAAPIVEGSVRKTAVGKFKYDIYYQVGIDEIFVFAIVHQRQHPDTWKKRL